jgi:tRNA G18 (ribose-2'-O)-methylase SpoU
MSVIRIDRIDDPRLEVYRCVSDGELLRRRNLFVAEGRLVVCRLLASGHRVLSLLVNEASLRALAGPLSRAAASLPVYLCSSREFESITGFHLHRGCLAMAERPRERTLREIVNGSEILLALEAIADADNVGGVFRNAAAFGADGVLLSPTCCDPLYRKAVRTSMGSVLRVPYARLDDWPHQLSGLRSEGFSLIALTPAPDAIDLMSIPRHGPGRRIAVLVGSEGAGLSADALQMADVRVRIPIDPDIDSLNLATATGIALYQIRAPNP